MGAKLVVTNGILQVIWRKIRNGVISNDAIKKAAKAGDVFVIQPRTGIFFLGLVMRTGVPSRDPMINGWNLIFIFKGATKELVVPSDLNNRELLIPPKIVNHQGWLKGYFVTIGNLAIGPDEPRRDFGFWDIVTRQFVDQEGQLLETEPAIWGDYGLGSYGLVSYAVAKAVEVSHELE